MLPIYNSTSGTVTQTVDLMRKYSFFITAMNRVEVAHCLAALPGTEPDEISAVYSHPQALSQCSDFLSARGLVRRDYSNTATAAKMVGESGDNTIAAICSEECAHLNGLNILASRISNVVPNFTQFICITKDMQVSEREGKSEESASAQTKERKQKRRRRLRHRLLTISNNTTS